ncbi:DNA integrity scanning diadenylate cyclase DisA [Salisediminibacterium halotolerans]|uniref:DNA integrity scanning protein DisA n=1 Tax=Salisediminibacterium halotolerans TaxID=517425 RepID=A0A1H9USL3_9BACI|nr:MULTISPECIES: DNA integrity scanning diadenylate cyclase DisA [Salisediminibacterium]RLJ73049.1 diadenylate cyclase [Actinophytocola xinjiangensis]RPE86471.1 diadenylate cyclase [Salisediminibacterium halotolerans]TWG33846.1 diadenylate cyclase [Salisediminibacterium halotolerans]SES12057.1 diadenylate cyclase [Salisediminibacterium haloalkalitolerans]GEL08370.1 DNA integrity scanning protein DisA [Salisediminibacterium halotolerans]
MDHQNSNYDQQFVSRVLRFVSPGTPLREGIDNVLRANTGGLIVLGYNAEMMNIVNGGFFINCNFSPAYLYELAKMDGAIILSEDASRILYANTQLVPDNDIESTETGIRHRTAQRVARQTGNLVISISQRRNVITLYQGDYRYALKDIGVILTKANQAIQTLEKYKSVLDQSITNLGALEFEELVTFQDVSQVMHRVEMVLRIKSEIKNYVNELGDEGRLISMQLEELVSNTEKEALDLIKDYQDGKMEDPRVVLSRLQRLSSDDLLDDQVVVKLLGYPRISNLHEYSLEPRGYRILNKIPRIPPRVVENLVGSYHSLQQIMRAEIAELDEVDGIGEVRARKIKEGLSRIQEQLFIDRHI